MKKSIIIIAAIIASYSCTSADEKCADEKAEINKYYDQQLERARNATFPNTQQIDAIMVAQHKAIANACK